MFRTRNRNILLTALGALLSSLPGEISRSDPEPRRPEPYDPMPLRPRKCEAEPFDTPKYFRKRRAKREREERERLKKAGVPGRKLARKFSGRGGRVRGW